MRTKLLSLFGVAVFLFSAAGCEDKPSSGKKPYDPAKIAEIVPTVYGDEAVKDVSQTEAGDIDSWKAEVFTSNGGNNDMPTKDGVIKSPWHKLNINGVEVPVYSARCAKGVHSFAWVDVTSNQEDFILNVSLEMNRAYKKCVVLPLSRDVEVEIADKTFSSVINAYGSYTYTFATSADAAITNPELAPLTIMVTKEEPLEIPVGYDVQYIEPGYHETGSLEFTEKEMIYVMKAGLHDISSINVPDGSTLYLERGAYLKCTDRELSGGNFDKNTAIHIEDCANAKVLGRGILDMGECLGGDNKNRHVVNVKRVENLVVRGLTVINSNTWTMCFYNSDNVLVESNLLLGYRTYSDGIMMSECRDSVGRYNFVRTGDDAIEFKGTGWGGSAIGSNCLYEYNDCWTDKATGYGVVWESACDMENMTFRNNSVGFAQPVWQTYSSALDCRLGTNAKTRWGEILFENIEIYHVISPNVMAVRVRGAGAILDNVTFKNINVYSTELGVFAFSMFYSATGGSITNIKLKDIQHCGKTLKASDKNDASLFRNEASSWFDELTVE
ncbi:MAG: hypothetical protein IJY62_05280 [Clostridia bacterium]|nr:hypothetical protein [Clostridia bacterium]